MKVLLTGSNGLVGQHLLKLLLKTTNYDVIATGKGPQRTAFVHDRLKYHQLDITDGMSVQLLIDAEQPSVVVHSAAMTQADQCEEDEIGCWNVNVTATRFLVDAAKKVNAFFIFLSTDFVFDGMSGPYDENAYAEPISYYGSSKVAAEKAVAESGIAYAIIRTCLVYGNIIAGTRSNIISWVKESLQAGKKINVVDDQWRTPTYVEDLAKGILLVIDKEANGLFHISGEEMMTPFDMAMAAIKHYQLDASLITAVNAATFTQPAKRPAKTGFIIDKAKKILGYQPISFAEGIQKMND